MKMPPFDYACPASLDEAVSLLASNEGAKVLSGGQSLIPLLAFRLAHPPMLVDIQNIAGLDSIEIVPDGLRVGARVRWCQIEEDRRLAEAHPLFQEMISHVAHYQIRNRGTVGGSLAHADPAAEMPGVAVVCGCDIVVAGASGKRTINSSSFFTGPLQTALADDEIITEVRFPPWRHGRRWGFQELSRRKGDFAMAGVAAFYDLDDHGRVKDAHVGAIGADDTPVRLAAVEECLNGKVLDDDLIAQARVLASASVHPNSDIHGAADYRRSLVGTLAARVLRGTMIMSGAKP